MCVLSCNSDVTATHSVRRVPHCYFRPFVCCLFQALGVNTVSASHTRAFSVSCSHLLLSAPFAISLLVFCLKQFIRYVVYFYSKFEYSWVSFFLSVSETVFFFFPIIFISWRLITLQYCNGFCHTLTWLSHGFTCVPHPDPSSHLPPHPIPLGHSSAPAPSTCLLQPTWTGDLFHTW